MTYLTKVLIEEVLSKQISSYRIVENNIIYNNTINDCEESINIYEFAHLCKEYMKSNYICVWSGNGYNKSIGYECSITHFMCGDLKTFKADTENEAIFYATLSLINGEVNFGD